MNRGIVGLNWRRTLWIAAGLFILSGTATAADPAKLRGWIAYFKAHDAVVDATENHKNGKIYVIGAMGVGFYYPGIDYKAGDKVTKEHGQKFLPATSDAIENEVHSEYVHIATKYATQYNQTTLKLLGIPDERPGS